MKANNFRWIKELKQCIYAELKIQAATIDSYTQGKVKINRDHKANIIWRQIATRQDSIPFIAEDHRSYGSKLSYAESTLC